MMMGGVEGGGEHGGGDHDDPDHDDDPVASPPPGGGIYTAAPTRPTGGALDRTFTQRAAAGGGADAAPVSEYGNLELSALNEYGVVNMADGYENTGDALGGDPGAGAGGNPGDQPQAQAAAREGQTRFWTRRKVAGLIIISVAGVLATLLSLYLTGQFDAKPATTPTRPPPPPPPPPTITTGKGPVAFPDMMNWSGGGSVTIDVLANDVAGDMPIDAATLKIVGLMDMDDGNTPDATLSADGIKLDVTGQGVWTVVDDTAAKTSRIAFTPDASLTGNPNPIVYRVSDTAKLQSNDGVVVVSSDVGKLAAAITALAGKSDADFWAAYKRDLIDPSPALDIEVIRRVTLSLQTAALMTMTPADRATSVAQYPQGAALTAIYDTWTNAGGGLAALYAESEKITDATTGLGKVRNGTRLVRLNTIGRLIVRKQMG